MNYLKYVSLITLTIQNAWFSLSIYNVTSRPGPKFYVTTAVFMSEVVKCVICLIIVSFESKSLSKFTTTVHATTINIKDTAKVCVPSFVFLLQNILLYSSYSNLDAATYKVACHLKILTTALFTVLILRKTLLKIQWASLVLLLIGVVLVQLAVSDPLKKVSEHKPKFQLDGFSAALIASFISGLTTIYFEKILKQSNISVWMRNLQLSLLSLPFGLISCYAKDSVGISENGFFYGYDLFVINLVIMQAVSGLIVALVVKHANNIVKTAATSLAIIISCIASIYLFNFHLKIQFALGALLVIFSIFMYRGAFRRGPRSTKNRRGLP